jgi:hypothetical protein
MEPTRKKKGRTPDKHLENKTILKPTIGNESSHDISKDNEVRVVNFATSKNLVVKSTTFPHRSIHKYTWTSPDGKTHNLMITF